MTALLLIMKKIVKLGYTSLVSAVKPTRKNLNNSMHHSVFFGFDQNIILKICEHLSDNEKFKFLSADKQFHLLKSKCYYDGIITADRVFLHCNPYWKCYHHFKLPEWDSASLIPINCTCLTLEYNSDCVSNDGFIYSDAYCYGMLNENITSNIKHIIYKIDVTSKNYSEKIPKVSGISLTFCLKEDMHEYLIANKITAECQWIFDNCTLLNVLDHIEFGVSYRTVLRSGCLYAADIQFKKIDIEEIKSAKKYLIKL